MDYLILITLIIAFLSKQYIGVLQEKLEKSKDSFLESRLINKINTLDKLSAFLITILVIEIIIWLAKI